MYDTDNVDRAAPFSTRILERWPYASSLSGHGRCVIAGAALSLADSNALSSLPIVGWEEDARPTILIFVGSIL